MPSALTNPASNFAVAARRDLAGFLYLDVWAQALTADFRSVIDGIIFVTIDRPDITSPSVSIPRFWTGEYVAVSSESTFSLASALVNASLVSAVETTPGSSSVNEVQNLQIPADFNNGSIRLRYNDRISQSLSVSTLTGSQIDSALELLIESVNSVSVSPVGQAKTFDITFTGAMAGQNVPRLVEAFLDVNPVQTTNGSTTSQLLGSFKVYADPVDLLVGNQAQASETVAVKVGSFTDAENNTYKDDAGYTVRAAGAVGFDWVTSGASSKSNNSLSGTSSASALVVGYDGDDTGVNLSAGDAFIGGPGTDTAVLSGSGALGVKLVEPLLAKAMRAAVSQVPTTGVAPEIGSVAVDAGDPIFAVRSGSADPVFVEAENVQLGSGSAQNPALMLAGGANVRLVGSAFGAFHASITSAISAATNGDLILVAANHVDSATSSITVDKNDLRIVLLNDSAPTLNFTLAESASVTKFTLLGIGQANITGNSFANMLIGNEAANQVDGKGGNDSILGMSGDDVLFGGSGNDWIDGSEGWDSVFGGSGNDTLISEEGGEPSASSNSAKGELLDGGSGSDLLFAGGSGHAAAVRMLGGGGADVFRVGSTDGADGQVLAAKQQLRAFISDLGSTDGLDLSAFRASSTATDPLTSSSVVSRAIPTNAGDSAISLAGLSVQGLKGPTGTATNGAAPVSELLSGSHVTVSAAGSAGEPADWLAEATVLMNPSNTTVPFSKTSQQVLDAAMTAVYVPQATLLDSLFYQPGVTY